jgi:protein-S-isoprenylcysteine O-methyltransferase Ste14
MSPPIRGAFMMTKIATRLTELFNKVSTGSPRLKTILAPTGGIFFFGVIFIIVLLSFWMDGLIEAPAPLPEPANIFVSLPFLWLGLFLILWSLYSFFKVKGTPVPFAPPPTLITSGPYAWTRNPMLTGTILFLFGIGLISRSLFLTLVFTPLFAVLMSWEVKNVEEPELLKRFGDQYRDYINKIPRVLPRLSGLRLPSFSFKFWKKSG